MKVLLAVGDDPARLSSALTLAPALAEHGVESIVLAASTGTGETRLERGDEFARIVRVDPAPRHWQRSRSIEVARIVRDLIAERRIDLVHVVDWRGLTHDLVATAASVGVPSIVELVDPAYACLVGDRVRRDVHGACDAALGPMPCLACAEADPAHGPTPWVPIEARFIGVAERRRDAVRELELARFVLVHDERAPADARRALEADLARVTWRRIANSGDAAELARAHAAALGVERPLEAARPAEWWVERMQSQAESAWDASFLRARSST